MSECYSTVMRESSLDQHVTVETSHLRNCKYTDSTEGTCCNRKNLAMCDICTKLVVRCTLQTIEGDISRLDISLKSSVCNLDRKGSCHDHLIFHLTEGQLAGCCVSTMESHKGILKRIVEFSFDRFFVHILRNGVIDIKKCNDIITYYLSDKLT